MENFYLEETPKTPKILFDFEGGKLIIHGRSIPENSVEFYKPLYEYLDLYRENAKPITYVEIMLEYFNTSSSKCLIEVFKRLERLSKADKAVRVKWYYEEDDEDMKESGEDFKEIINIPIEMSVLEE
jgi:hypothetical protein